MKKYLSLNRQRLMDTNDNGFKLKSNQHIINIVGPVSEFNPETGDEEISFSLEHLFPQDRSIIQQALMMM